MFERYIFQKYIFYTTRVSLENISPNFFINRNSCSKYFLWTFWNEHLLSKVSEVLISPGVPPPPPFPASTPPALEGLLGTWELWIQTLPFSSHLLQELSSLLSVVVILSASFYYKCIHTLFLAFFSLAHSLPQRHTYYEPFCSPRELVNQLDSTLLSPWLKW